MSNLGPTFPSLLLKLNFYRVVKNTTQFVFHVFIAVSTIHFTIEISQRMQLLKAN